MRDPGWLAVIAVIAALNPGRIASSLPPGQRSRQSRTITTALGALPAAALLVGIAAAGPLLASGLDVSAPTLRVAAGIALLAAASRDLFAAHPHWEPALPGWWAAAVPIAVPLVLRPELGLVVLSIGADGGVGIVVAALVVGVALTIAAALGSAERWYGRVLGWGAQSLAVAGLLSGVGLAVSGILDI